MKLPDKFIRTKMLYGEKAVDIFSKAHVAVFGVGGVGGYVVEALVRSGVGAIDIIDNDIVSVSNINRQIIADDNSVGKYKTDVMRDRILSINPDCKIKTYKSFILPENASDFDFSDYDYVVDAIDTVSGKLAIIKSCKTDDIPVISAMGAANKLDPTRFEVADIYETSVCPLAKVMRRLCRENNIDSLKVVYSREEPVEPLNIPNPDEVIKKRVPASGAVCPAVAGLIIASEVLKDLSKKTGELQ